MVYDTLTIILIIFAVYMTGLCYFFNKIINNAFKVLDQLIEVTRNEILK